MSLGALWAIIQWGFGVLGSSLLGGRDMSLLPRGQVGDSRLGARQGEKWTWSFPEKPAPVNAVSCWLHLR